jgi:hypothetical protein
MAPGLRRRIQFGDEDVIERCRSVGKTSLVKTLADDIGADDIGLTI